MKWFKHDTTATTDAKMKKLILRHGAVGYAVYFHCLELIAGNVSENNVTFELEHDSEIIADDLKICGDKDKSGREIVEEIMRTIVDLNLFEEDNGRIFCFKLLRRIDSSMTSSARLRTLVEKAKTQSVEIQQVTSTHNNIMDNHDLIMESHDEVMGSHARLDKTRLDKTRLDNNMAKTKKTRTKKDFVPPTVEEVSAYCQQMGYKVNAKDFVDYYTDPENPNVWLDKNNEPVKNWKLKLKCWNSNSKTGNSRNYYGSAVSRSGCDDASSVELNF